MAGLSNTQRSLRYMREQGLVAAITEKWNPHVRRGDGGKGIRQDLFGIIDVLALDPERGVVGVQVCSGTTLKGHWEKITGEGNQAAADWLKTPGTSLEIHAWRQVKVKRGGKAMRWEPRIVPVTLEDLHDQELSQEEVADAVCC